MVHCTFNHSGRCSPRRQRNFMFPFILPHSWEGGRSHSCPLHRRWRTFSQRAFNRPRATIGRHGGFNGGAGGVALGCPIMPCGKMLSTLQRRMASQARLTSFRLNFQPPVDHPLGVQPTVQPTRDLQSISCWAVGPPSYLKLPLGAVSSGAYSPPLASCPLLGASPLNPHMAHMALCLPVVHG